MQHALKCIKDAAHLWDLVGKEVGIVHVVHNHRSGYLKDDKSSIADFSAIESDVVELCQFGDCAKCLSVPYREIRIERDHQPCFLIAATCVLEHFWVRVVHDPMPGDSHVTDECLALDQNDSGLSEQAICASIVDERRDE